MIKGPSSHLSWNELACWNQTGRTWRKWVPGELVDAYPQAWRESHAVRLAVTFEEIRARLGNVPIAVSSAYRTIEYNAHIGGAKGSQHIYGRALDIRHAKLPAPDLLQAIQALYRAGRLPLLGGLGGYPTFVHIDVRDRRDGRLAVWHG
jgi:uncharacterized protein YcbK (DUF882 family)